MQEIKSGLDMYIPFAEKLDVRMLHRHVGDVGLELDLTEDHMNSWQMAHGGVIMSMLDIVMGMSAQTLDDASNGAATVELNQFSESGYWTYHRSRTCSARRAFTGIC